MRALGLLLLCVVLLAVLQASYIVAEAKKHDGDRKAEHDEPRLGKHNKHKQGKERKEEKISASETEVADKATEEEKPYNDVMLGDQPDVGERGGRGNRRDRVNKEERKARRNQRRNNNERGGGDGGEREGEEGGERERRPKKGKQARRQQKKENRQSQSRSTCSSQSDCGDNECCLPNRAGEMTCKPNRRPRTTGKKCLSTCMCQDDLKCYAPTEQSGRRRNRVMGKCTAADQADLALGTVLEGGATNSKAVAEPAAAQEAP